MRQAVARRLTAKTRRRKIGVNIQTNYRIVPGGLLTAFVSLGLFFAEPGAAQEAPKRGSSADALHAAPAVGSGTDPLDVALERAGMRRSDLGRVPRGWW